MKTQAKELRSAIANFRTAKSQLEAVRNRIAQELCPIKIGEKVLYSSGGKIWEGVVDNIHYSSFFFTFDDPDIDEISGWSVEGLKIKKTTGKTGKQRFSFCSHESKLVAGIWETTAENPDRWNKAISQ